MANWWDGALKNTTNALVGAIPGMGMVNSGVKMLTGESVTDSMYNNNVGNNLTAAAQQGAKKVIGAQPVIGQAFNAVDTARQWNNGDNALNTALRQVPGYDAYAGLSDATSPTQPKPTTPQTQQSALMGDMQDYFKQQRAWQAQDRQRRDDEYARIQGLANPFDSTSSAYQAQLRNAGNNVTSQMAGAGQGLFGNLASRGMAGSGHAAAAQAGLAGHRASALSNALNSVEANRANQFTNYENQRTNTLAGLMGQQQVNPAGFGLGLGSQMSQDARYADGRGDLDNQAMQSILARILMGAGGFGAIGL